MVYNTAANVRLACGMPTATPADATIAYWQTLIDAMIVKYNPAAATAVACIVEMDKLYQAYTNLIKHPDTIPTSVLLISPLSEEEKEMLNPLDTVTDKQRTKWWV